MNLKKSRRLFLAATCGAALLTAAAHVSAGQAGALAGWGQMVAMPPVEPGSRFTAVSAGGPTLTLKGDGTVVTWGLKTAAESMVPAGLSGVVAIAAYYGGLALKSDGTVVAWGDNSYGQFTVPPGLSNVVAIAAGPAHSLALKSDGTVVAWGDNSTGECIVPPSATDVTAIAAGGGVQPCPQL